MTVDLQTNLVTIIPGADVALRLEAIPAAIHRAGFQPGGLSIEAVGSFESEPQPGFRIRSWPTVFELDSIPKTRAQLRVRAVVDTAVNRAPRLGAWMEIQAHDGRAGG